MREEARRLQALPPEEIQLRETTPQQLLETLNQHRKWVASDGQEGVKADLSRADLAGADLTGAILRKACLSKANLRRADLAEADLRGADLILANLQGACLLGTHLREASLHGATLQDVSGLRPAQLAAANLSGAVLPRAGLDSEGLGAVEKLSRRARQLFRALLLASVLVGVIIAFTTDVQLVTNSSPLPLPYVDTAVPLAGFYLAGPFFLLGLFVAFHFHLRRLWEALGEMPAVFSDGRSLEERVEPWLLLPLLREHIYWLRKNRPPLSALEKNVARLFAYWVAPATLVLFWARYLTRQDLRDSMLHVALVVAGTALALHFQDLIGRTLRREEPRQPLSRTASRRFRGRAALLAAVGGLLALLTLGTVLGAPHDTSRAAELGAGDARRWAPFALWAFGHSPFANLTQKDVSRRPPGWSGAEQSLGAVAGARLNRLSLRYAEGYRAFLVNAELWQADLEGAYLSEADLRGANLRQATLPAAVLDRSRLAGANLQEAELQQANLSRADLSRADLSYADLYEAVLVDATLENANLYAASLQRAWLSHANLLKADLRRANVQDAKLVQADLRGAFLWSARLSRAALQDAQLQSALLIETDLKDADLRGAQLQEAVLNRANLSGANLQNADLRGAVGLTAEQVCSARERRGLELDDALLAQVEQRCGPIIVK